MKKVYEPLNMIKNGRYAVLYGKLAPEIQQQILSRMTELIPTDNGRFMTPWEAKWMALSGSAILVGMK